jgi:transposase
MQNNQAFAFARGYFWGIRPIIRKPHIICAVILVTKSKDGDYHQEMNSFVFLEWFENQLMPALKNSSLVVLDNAS